MPILESDASPLVVLLPPFVKGWLLLICCHFTLTYQRSLIAKCARLILAPIAIYYFYNFGYAHYWTWGESISGENFTGIASLTFVHISAILDASIISFNDPSPPLWVSKETRKPLPLPTTFLGRLQYALDLWGSPRGSSWISGRHWDFAPGFIANYRSPYKSRLAFVVWTFINAQLALLSLDIVDTYTKQFRLDTTSTTPITSFFPWYTQFAFSFHLCAYVYANTNLLHAYISIICVGLGLTPDPDVWPPVFVHPYLSPNLTQYWGQDWHALLRRIFLRLSSLFIQTPRPSRVIEAANGQSGAKLESPEIKLNGGRSTWRRFIATTVVFAASALYHGIIYARPPADVMHPHRSLIEKRVMMFFLVQPIGITLDSFLGRFIRRPGISRVVRRVFAWTWLLWTTRWWADDYAKKGLWDHKENSLFVSPTRGILWGKWKL